jgi:hypothetical protein
MGRRGKKLNPISIFTVEREGGGRKFVTFEIFMSATMKNAVFWDVTQCDRRFGGT